MGETTSGKLLRHGGAYLFFSILSKIAAFLVLPIVTSYLSIDEYGVYSNLVAVQNILSGFATLGLDAAYGRYLYIYNSPAKLRVLTSTITTFIIIWGGVFFFISVLIVSVLLESWNYNNNHEIFYISIFLPLTVLVKQYSLLNSFLMQSVHQTKELITINSTGVVFIQVFVLIFLVGMDLSVLALIAAQAIIYFFIFIVHLKKLLRLGLVKLFHVSMPTLKKNLKYGIGFLPSIWGLWLFTSSDRFFITYMVSTEATGKFSFLAQFSMLIMTIVQSVAVVYWPIFLELMKQEDRVEKDEKIEAFISLSIYILLFLFLGICVFVPIAIEALFREDYQGDYVVLYVLTLSAVFLAIRKIFAQTLGYYMKVSWLSASSYIPALLNVLLNLFLIPKYGIYGAAAATLLSALVYVIVVFLMSQRLHKVELEKLKFGGVFILVLSMVGVSYIYPSIYVGVSLVLFYLLIGWVLKIHRVPSKL